MIESSTISNSNILPFSAKVSKITGSVDLISRMWSKSKLTLKPVSQDYFNKITKNKFDKFIGDVNKCGLVNLRTLSSLQIEQTSWVQVYSVLEDSKKIPNSPIDFYNLMPQVPFKRKETTEPFRLIQTLFIDSMEDFIMCVTEENYFNIMLSLQMPQHQPCMILVKETDMNFMQPKVAQQANVALIQSPFEVTFDDINEVLQNYFEVPKYLVVNDIFGVDLVQYAPNLACSAIYYDMPTFYFKVIDIKEDTTQQKNIGSYVVKDYTNLYIESNVQSYLPVKLSKCIQQDTAYVDLPLCPSGLDCYYKQLFDILMLYTKTKHVGTQPKLLLSGARGSGKKTILSCVAKSLGYHILTIDCFDLYMQSSSLVEGKLKQIFVKWRKSRPCILVLLNIELLGKDKENQEDDRVISYFTTNLHEILNEESNERSGVLVGITNNKPDTLIPMIAREFIETIEFKPSEGIDTCLVLDWFVKSYDYICDLQIFKTIVKRCSGFVFADLGLLVKHAIKFCMINNSNKTDNVLTLEYFEKALDLMDSAYSDTIGAPRIPSVYWKDVGGLVELKEEITSTINFPLKYPHLAATGLRRSGILLYGPPGTGKTLIAKAVATEFSLNFLSVKGPELMNMYVGQSEQNIREVFTRARDASPCIIFFDELDSLAPNRGRSGDSGGVTDRVVSQLLAEMDGLQKNVNLFVIAATNRPDLVDPALLRPGRFDKMMYVGACLDVQSKLSVFMALTRKFKLSSNVNLEILAGELPPQVTGADLYSVCSNAWSSAATRAISSMEAGIEVEIPVAVTSDDFLQAIRSLVPSVKEEDLRYYQQLKALER